MDVSLMHWERTRPLALYRGWTLISPPAHCGLAEPCGRIHPWLTF
jgi:hypothetical protein